MKPFKFLLFFFYFFISLSFIGVDNVYGQSCANPVGDPHYVNCGGNTTSIVDPSPYGHFSNSAVGTTGTLTVSCEQRVLNTSQRLVQDCAGAPSEYLTSCEANVQNTGTDVSCNVLTTCGNSVKEPFECCDGGANCNAACQCVFSQSEQGSFCGDGICGSGENSSNCPVDCSVASSCTEDETPFATIFGPSDVIVYQGETTAVTSIIRDSGPGPGSVSVNYVFNGCPDGATCTGDVGFAYAEGDETDSASMIISTTGSTPVGNYPVIAHFYNPSNNSCSDTIRYNVIVRPSRKTVCDGTWYEITPGPYIANGAASLGGAGVFYDLGGVGYGIRFGYTHSNIYYENTCSYPISGSNDTCTWYTSFNNFNQSQQITQPPYLHFGLGSPYYPANIFSFRLRFANSTTYRFYPTWGSGTGFNEGDVGYSWGTPVSTTDKFNRTYNFRKSGSMYQYSCTATQPDMTVDTMTVLGTLNAGQSLGFRGTVRNTGSASTVASESRLRIDVGNNGSWDVTVSPNQSTGVLAPSGSEIETWNNAWTATAGTHRFEICADTTGVVTESNEGNNCSPAGTGVFTVNTLPVTVSINAAQNPVVSGNSTNITWSTTNETSCDTMTCTSGSCAWMEDDNAGSPVRSTGALTASRTYSMTCYPGPVTGNLTVNVSPAEYSLNVIKSGKGKVTSNPAGINCDVSCASQSADFDVNSTVVLTAEAAPGRIFTGWAVQGGGSCPGKGTCSVLINAAKTVTANFAVDPNYKEF